MKWIVITPPDFVAGEAYSICQLLDAGVDVVHLRKPYSKMTECEKLLNDIPSQYHSNIVIHDHFELCNTYQLKGIHLNTRHREIPPLLKRKSVSFSCHSFAEVIKQKSLTDYVFLSPIFDSISKDKYSSAFRIEELQQAKEAGIINERVMALGGMSLDKLPLIQSLSFGGAVFLGDIWQRLLNGNPYDNIYYLHKLQKALK